MRPVLHIGNKNYSSWSLRPWLALRWAGVDFDTVLHPLGGEGYGRAAIPAIRAVSPTGKVPVLHVDGLVIHDSLAIGEWAAEQAGPGVLWPQEAGARALGRAATAEMHSGFGAIRRDLSMNLRRRLAAPPTLPSDTQAELERLFVLWGDLRARFAAEGPWLLGRRSLADAFYLPVATRLRTYAIPMPAHAAAWVHTALADADFRAWDADAARETWQIASTDDLFPGA